MISNHCNFNVEFTFDTKVQNLPTPNSVILCHDIIIRKSSLVSHSITTKCLNFVSYLQVEAAKRRCTQGFLIQSLDLVGLAAHDIAPIDTQAAKVG